jgi:hypothetical protein
MPELIGALKDDNQFVRNAGLEVMTKLAEYSQS